MYKFIFTSSRPGWNWRKKIALSINSDNKINVTSIYELMSWLFWCKLLNIFTILVWIIRYCYFYYTCYCIHLEDSNEFRKYRKKRQIEITFYKDFFQPKDLMEHFYWKEYGIQYFLMSFHDGLKNNINAFTSFLSRLCKVIAEDLQLKMFQCSGGWGWGSY